MPFTLYYSPGACSLAVHIVLEELEHDFQLSLVSVANGDTSSESYLKINPKGRVPALRMNDHTLTEAPAILMYLGESSPDRNMIPKSAMEKGRSLEWLNWLSTTVHTQGFGQLWRPGRFSDVPEHVSALQAKGRETIVNALGDINAKLQGRHWAVGEHSTDGGIASASRCARDMRHGRSTPSKC